MGNDNKKKVSVVIPCRNEEKYIEQCVMSILNQSYDNSYIEILVVDGFSNDKTRDIVKNISKIYPNVILLDNEKRVAPVAMNIGIKYCSGDIVIIFGAHSYMDSRYIELCVNKLSNDNVDCVGGKIINISEDEKAKAISIAMGSPFGVGNALFRYSDKEQYVDTVAFGAYKKEVLADVGYFDEEFVRNQDDELNYRIIQSGRKILLSPEITSYYYTRGSFSKLWKQYFQYGFWKVRVIQKHKRPASLRHLVPAAFVLSIGLGAILGVFSILIRALFLIELALYVSASLIFALKGAVKEIKFVPHVITSFFILHASYGIGFLQGILNFYLFKTNKLVEKNSKMSR